MTPVLDDLAVGSTSLGLLPRDEDLSFEELIQRLREAERRLNQRPQR
jgi:hypothetical protein